MIISLIGQKGGVGKSTLATCLAAEYHLRGATTLLVDADPQGSVRTWGDVAAEAGQAGPTIVSMGSGLHKPDQLPALAQNFDVTVIDCPPRLGDIQRAAMMVSNLAVLPCGPQPSEVWALAATLEIVEEARMLRPDLVAAIVVTRRRHTSLGRTIRESLTATGLPVLRSALGLRSDFEEAMGSGMGVTSYAPNGKAADEVRDVLRELEELALEGDHA